MQMTSNSEKNRLVQTTHNSVIKLPAVGNSNLQYTAYIYLQLCSFIKHEPFSKFISQVKILSPGPRGKSTSMFCDVVKYLVIVLQTSFPVDIKLKKKAKGSPEIIKTHPPGIWVCVHIFTAIHPAVVVISGLERWADQPSTEQLARQRRHDARPFRVPVVNTFIISAGSQWKSLRPIGHISLFFWWSGPGCKGQLSGSLYPLRPTGGLFDHD